MQAELEYEDNQDDLQTFNTLDLAETKNIVRFQHQDTGNPHNWSHKRRAFITFVTIVTVLNSVLGSSLPSGYANVLGEHFGVTSQLQLVLPISVWLMGYVGGPLVFSPLSERYGRQVVMFSTFAGFTIFNVAINFSPNWASFVVFRLLMGICGSSPISVGGGIFADMYNNPVHRGRAMAFLMIATGYGAIIAPLATGYLGTYGWRWPTWFQLCFTGTSWFGLVFLPETYAPVILLRRAKKIRKAQPGINVMAPIELEKSGFRELMVVVLSRPLRMLFTEWIVLFVCLYLAFIYAIYYMFFQAFPIIFIGIYGFSAGEEGLAFNSIGVGSLITLALWLWYDKYYHNAVVRGEAWTKREEYRRLPLACLAAPFLTIGMFWIGWSARPGVHWIVPVVGGIPFGFGFSLLFMALTNYIVDAYQVFAASALAASSCSRSLFGALLPFATQRMFDTLGVAWACSLLGFVSLALALVPFAFIRFGDKIRANSKFCQQLAEEQRKIRADEERREKKREARERRAATSARDLGEEEKMEEVDR
jgi:MFS family permease